MHVAHINGAVKYAVKMNLSPPVHNAYNGCSCSTFVPVTSHNAKADLNSGQAFKLPTLWGRGFRKHRGPPICTAFPLNFPWCNSEC